MTAAKRSASEAVLEALSAEGDRWVAEVALAAGVGRSTAGKALAALEQSGKVQRAAGARDGAHRLPDRWSLAAADVPPAPSLRGADDPTTPDGAADRSADPKAEPDDAPEPGPARDEAGGRLRPGQLDGIVLEYLTAHANEGPLGPGAVAKALGRSSGAVGNCLARLAAAGRARLVGEQPRRYSL